MHTRVQDDTFPYEASFFAIRAPLLAAGALGPALPVAIPEAVGDALPEALARDGARAQAALRALVADPVVREALWVASPELVWALDRWEQDPADPHARNVPGSLYRYLGRMARRPTPFGLFAGVALGAVGPGTRLELSAEQRRHTRLDMAWLTALVDALEPILRERLRYRPNTSLYRSAGQLRYAEVRLTPDTRERKNEQVALTSTPAIEAVLAATPAPVDELGERVIALYPEVEQDAARGFIDGLIDGQLLVPELALKVTGDDPLGALVVQLRPLAPEVAQRLAQVQAELRALDAAGPGQTPSRYAAITRLVQDMPAPPDPRRLFHVDLHLRGALSLGPAVIRAIEEAAAVLRRLIPWQEDPKLLALREGLGRRFGDGCWPLADVLDDERGLGFGGEGLSSEPSPLLEGLPFPGEPEAAELSFGARERWMLRRVVEAGPGGEWALDEADLAALAVAPGPPLPDSFAFFGHLEASSAEAVDSGEFRLHVQGFGGPSGVRMLGRFCLGDADLRAAVEDHLRAEERWSPDAVHAEIAHVPEGRMGNVLGRPRLRPYEIPYLGEGEAPADHQISLDELRLSTPEHNGQRLLLHSERLGREVLPRLSSAHDHTGGDLPIYRFLGALQHQGVRGGLAWTWGALTASPFLPRVRWRNVVFAPASWRLDADELRGLMAARGAARVLEARRLRAARRLPRRISLVQADNLLSLDLESPLALDALASAASKTKVLELREEVSDAALCVRGPDGPRTHELLVPFVRVRGEPRRSSLPRPSQAVRAWIPGSRWLYARIYAGTLTSDAVLAEVSVPLVAEARARGWLERWHFIRYIDRDWHLRVRLQVPSERSGDLLSRLHEALEPWLADRRIWRLDLDTYQPEVERYGGDEGMLLAERLFEADSDAAAGIVGLLSGDEGADARWRLALRGTHLLLEDLDIPLGRRPALLAAWRSYHAKIFRVDRAFETKLNQRFRELWPGLDPLLAPDWDPEHPLAPGFELLAARSAALQPVARDLRALEAAGGLLHPIEVLASSYAHMAMNRLLRSDQNRQELVLYDILARLYRSQLARSGG